ncbi:hypothetical protein D3C71_1194660 [compost metagenome]
MRLLQPNAVHIGNEHEQASQLLPTLDQAEFIGLLDRHGGVARRIGQRHDLGLGGLRLQEERRKIVRCARMLDRAQGLAARLFDGVFGIGLQGVAEGVVGRQEVPLLHAGLGQRAARAVGQRIGVVGPLRGGCRAGLACQVRRAGRGRQEGDVGGARDFLHSQRHGRGGHVDDGLHVFLIDPAARGGRTHVRLVLVVGGNDFNLAAQHGRPEVFHRHAGGFHRALPGQVGVHGG